MVQRCPRCRYALENPKALVCPNCLYSLRMPFVGMVGSVLVVGGLLSFFYAIFIEEMWVEVITGGIAAIVVGLLALLVAAVMMRRAHRA